VIRQRKVGYFVQPISKKFRYNVIEPLDVYRTVKEQVNDFGSFLLESYEGSKQSAQHSFIGFNPIGQIIIQEKELELLGNSFTSSNPITSNNDPIDIIHSLTNQAVVLDNGETSPFMGGAVGYFSYDIVRNYLNYLPEKPSSFQLPDAEFLLTNDVITFDHQKKEIIINCCALGKTRKEAKEQLTSAEERLQRIEELILSTEKGQYSLQTGEKVTGSSNTTKQEYMQMVRQAKEHIRQGDIFQVVLSKRNETDVRFETVDTYLALREMNPSPYHFLLEFKDHSIYGSSPEMLLRTNDVQAITKPIAGTRKRGRTELEDRALASEMMNDEKECAEHVMLVDLHRNDLGRVCRYGSVEVTEFMTVGQYSHVQHIVSTVEGEISRDKTRADALRSLFPAGTVSGAPKVRAMEIINELEQEQRGPYAGAVGYFSFNGNLDFAITIRTIIQANKKAYVQAGAGIVADSQPEKEWLEVEYKTQALMNSLGVLNVG
jgi:anthranilate synthase component 1